MNRRDTIIVAVLINTGLLAALFMMAIPTESPDAAFSMNTVAESSPNEKPNEEINPAQKLLADRTYESSGDEIDEVLKNYSKVPQPIARIADNALDQPSQQKKNSEVNQTDPDPKEKYVEIKVKKGDFLEKIAKANGVSIQAIMRANHLSSPKLDVGQVLRIPIEKEQTETTTTQKPKPLNPIASSDPEYYTIKSGDNPWKIARQYHVRFEDLLKLNDLDEGKARNLKPGDVLRVR